MTQENQKKGLNINAKSFIVAIAVIFALMVVTYVLTFFIPQGEYSRIEDANGNILVDPDSFAFTQASFPFWKWLLSPFLVLGAEGSGTIIAVIAFFAHYRRCVQQFGKVQFPYLSHRQDHC